MRAIDGASFSDISATTASFYLGGGLYGFAAVGTFASSPTVTLELLASDGATWLPIGTAFSAAGYATAQLVQGTYRFALANVTAASIFISRIPGE